MSHARGDQRRHQPTGRGLHANDHTEIEELKAAVHCATVLEHQIPPWRLDRRASTCRALKYRRGEGEIVIVNHDGRGWWDPGDAQAKGDVFSLVQYLQPELNFGEVRRCLRMLAGVQPTYLEHLRSRSRQGPAIPVLKLWRSRPPLTPGSPSWAYLAITRKIPAPVLEHARKLDMIREGPRGSAWFAHTDHAGRLTGIEMRGLHWRGFSADGGKTLVRLPVGHPCPRLVVLEAPIDALSLAALEGLPIGSLYVATTGGMGPGTIEALEQLLEARAGEQAAMLLVATDADAAGDRHAEVLARMAGCKGIRAQRLRPPHPGADWNDMLRWTGASEARRAVHAP